MRASLFYLLAQLYLAAYFIDSDWKLLKMIFNFCIVKSHRARHLERWLRYIFAWLGRDKILTITVDI